MASKTNPVTGWWQIALYINGSPGDLYTCTLEYLQYGTPLLSTNSAWFSGSRSEHFMEIQSGKGNGLGLTMVRFYGARPGVVLINLLRHNHSLGIV